MNALLNELVTRRGFRPKILVVDDQPLNIRLINELLKGDYDIIMAMDGKQAILKCQTQNPDLILLDVLMPGMSGHDICRSLKADEQTQNIPVIFLTSQDEEADEAQGFELGAVDFITKPIRSMVISARVRAHLTLKLQSDLLKTIGFTDGLTGIDNRRMFDENLQRNWLQCARHGQSISLFMIDIDHFKLYNDHYGHQRGDECLRAVANGIKKALRRPYDSVARYGGEEFACILQNTDSTGALSVAQTVLEEVRSLCIEHVRSSTRKIVTISIGVATAIPKIGDSADGLLKAADKELYNSKNTGRDRLSSIMLDLNATAG
ncbi:MULTISPECIES: diguanylate cyclase domain-containing protein [Pseudomonas syringae group]|uniref:diguanylate cyclase domain-containing protein n=1 Tax=Pseudomonas syringae group TaxID=136849 RepID=UPI000F004AFF|nr:diguanylate cyclase [Pseudomonas cannabina]MEE3923722.1 diguanylate cyclase [Pseudomonas viridiflava]MEE3930358.1 diguanylate cyclase [Pseudomonas viridiflava]MEE3940747.1 diguanylate cyclase [Pseudomonas viridiflava]MEE3966804.1 diguanylate cyclase [Pseudomonas viridiflava]MEE3980782.1 diguanylate cyclase [Pseudomonas viridiflava]